jgi:hypothetical protein
VSLWDSTKDALRDLASAAIEGAIEGGASGFIPLTRIGTTLIASGALKDYGSGGATKRQLGLVLAEIRKYGGSCEIKIDGKEIFVRVNFLD